MKKWVKLLCLMLVFSFIFPVLVACDKGNGSGNGNGTVGNEGNVTEEIPDTISGSKYNGKTFTIYSVEDMFEKRYFYADKETGDGMNDSLYMRQQNVQNTLNVSLVYKGAEGSGETPAYQQYATEVQNAIKAGDEKYQLVLTHAYYAIPTLVTNNSLLNLDELEAVKNGMNEDYWNKSVMDQVAYKGAHYLGYSDFNLARTYVIAFNKTLETEFSEVFEGKSMYELVNSGEWTLDKMSEIATSVYKDQGGVSKDTFGITGELWVPVVGFIQSSGESIVTESNGKYSVSWNNNTTVKNKIDKVVRKLKDLESEPETYFWKNKDVSGTESETVTLSSGRAFMQIMSSNELIGLTTTSVKFGVVPYPMYEAKQSTEQGGKGYQSLNWAGYMAVPANVTNKAMVGDVLECLSAYSTDVTKYYYEKLLGRKVSESPEDADMLDIIWDSLVSDFGVTYSMIDNQNNLDRLVYTVPFCLMNGTSFNAHSNKYLSGAQNAIKNNINK